MYVRTLTDITDDIMFDAPDDRHTDSRSGTNATKRWSSVPDVTEIISDDAGRQALHRFKLDKVIHSHRMT